MLLQMLMNDQGMSNKFTQNLQSKPNMPSLMLHVVLATSISFFLSFFRVSLFLFVSFFTSVSIPFFSCLPPPPCNPR